MRLALRAAGLDTRLEEWIERLPRAQREPVRIAWEYAVTIERTSPLVVQVAQALGMSPRRVDALFVQAAAL